MIDVTIGGTFDDDVQNEVIDCAVEAGLFIEYSRYPVEDPRDDGMRRLVPTAKLLTETEKLSNEEAKAYVTTMRRRMTLRGLHPTNKLGSK